MSDEATVQRIIAAVIERHGHPDVLINNAGMGGNTYRQVREGGMNGIADTPTEHWNEFMRNYLDFVSYIWEMNTSSVNGR